LLFGQHFRANNRRKRSFARPHDVVLVRIVLKCKPFQIANLFFLFLFCLRVLGRKSIIIYPTSLYREDGDFRQPGAMDTCVLQNKTNDNPTDKITPSLGRHRASEAPEVGPRQRLSDELGASQPHGNGAMLASHHWFGRRQCVLLAH
jgi:hypothetical protein